MSRPDRLFGPGAAAGSAPSPTKDRLATPEGRTARIGELRAYLEHAKRTNDADLRRDAERDLLALGVHP